MKAWELFDRAIKKGTEFFLMEERLDDRKEEKRRIGICRANAGVCYNSKRDKCTHCKCYMTSKVKMLRHLNPLKRGRVEITHCPLAKWGKALSEVDWDKEIEIANYYRKLDKKKLLTK